MEQLFEQPKLLENPMRWWS
nr:unnamed protein product [Callosobruchus chinensis]